MMDFFGFEIRLTQSGENQALEALARETPQSAQIEELDTRRGIGKTVELSFADQDQDRYIFASQRPESVTSKRSWKHEKYVLEGDVLKRVYTLGRLRILVNVSSIYHADYRNVDTNAILQYKEDEAGIARIEVNHRFLKSKIPASLASQTDDKIAKAKKDVLQSIGKEGSLYAPTPYQTFIKEIKPQMKTNLQQSPLILGIKEMRTTINKNKSQAFKRKSIDISRDLQKKFEELERKGRELDPLSRSFEKEYTDLEKKLQELQDDEEYKNLKKELESLKSKKTEA